MNGRSNVTCLGALVLVLATAACGSTSSGGGSTAAAGCAAGASKVTVGFSVYSFATPYGNVVTQGAKDAGTALCVNVVTNGTPSFDLNALDQIVESEASAGAQGLVAPGPDQIAKTLSDQQQVNGKPVAVFDQCSALLQSLCVTQADKASGRALGQKLLTLLGGTNATGAVLFGGCIPGLQVIENRDAGMREVLSQAKGLKLLPFFATDVDESKNLPIWEQAVAAHPDAKALVSLCSTDTQSIGRVNNDHNNQFVAVGYNITPATMAAVKSGGVQVAMGSGDYIQSYMAVRAVVESILTKKPMPVGWLDSGNELVTKDNVDTYLGFFNGQGQPPRDYYAKQLHEDYRSMVQPLAKQSA